jgi:hypothetical protein
LSLAQPAHWKHSHEKSWQGMSILIRCSNHIHHPTYFTLVTAYFPRWSNTNHQPSFSQLHLRAPSLSEAMTVDVARPSMGHSHPWVPLLRHAQLFLDYGLALLTKPRNRMETFPWETRFRRGIHSRTVRGIHAGLSDAWPASRFLLLR